MRKKEKKLYTVNKYNKEALSKAIGSHPAGNLFWGGGNTAKWDKLASQAYGANYGDAGFTIDDYMNSKNAFGISKKNNLFSKGNMSGMGKAALGVGLEMVDNIGKSDKFKRGMWDRLDPIHYFAGNNESTVGNAMGDVGVGLFKAGAQSGNLPLMIAGGVAKTLGSGVNALWGEGLDKEADASNKAAIAQNFGVNYNASNNDALMAQMKQNTAHANFKKAHTGGVFKQDEADEKNADDLKMFNEALAFNDRSKKNALYNISANDLDTARANYSAFGGPLGVIDYGFMRDYLDLKKQQNEVKNKIPGITQVPAFMEDTNTFDGGGFFSYPSNVIKKMQEKKAWDEAMSYFAQKMYNDLAETSGKYNPEEAEVDTELSNNPEMRMRDVLNAASKIVKGVGKQTKKKVANGEPYIPHITFANGGKKGKAVKKVQEAIYEALATPIHAVFGNPGKRRGYSGGRFGGAGVSGTWSDPTYSYNEIHPADTLFVPVTQTFNDAFADARRRGLDTFEFNGGIYGTELGDNPNWEAAGNARTRDAVIPVPIPADTIRRTSDVPRNDTIITDDAYRRYPISTSNIRETLPVGFAFGGDMQTNGADFPTKLTHIDAGKSHEENPNGGVQMGVDPQGVPNLVEENETVYDDYVFSERIEMDAKAKAKFHISKKKDYTYAEYSKKLEKEIQERPNDPISRAGFEAQMQDLAEEQERQKAEMEAERAREAFEALSPEEQVALMQQMSQQQAQEEQMVQEQMAQENAGGPATMNPEEAAMQEQAMAEQQAMQAQQMQGMPVQGSPEEMTMQEQMVQQQAPAMASYGGCINKFDKGGVLKLLNSLGYKTVADAEKAGWKPSDFGDYKDWKDINNDSLLSDDFAWTDEFSKRITAPDMRAALSLGWNPLLEAIRRRWYEGENGNAVGWTESARKNYLTADEFKDYANRYKNTLGWAVKNGKIKAPTGNQTISMAEITNAMREAPDWKATDDWLYSDIANQAAYLGMARGLNPDNDTKFINRWSPYGTFNQGEDGTWTYTLNPNLTDEQKAAFTNQFKKARTDNKVGIMYNSYHDPTTSVNNYLLDEKGNPILITDEDLSNYTLVNSYTWGNPDEDINKTAAFYVKKTPEYNADNLYGAPWAPGAGGTTTRSTTDTKTGEDTKPASDKDKERNYKPKYQHTLFGIEDLGPIAALAMQGFGIGRPKTGGLTAAASQAGVYDTADWMPIDPRVRFKENDPWFYTSPIMGESRAVSKNLANTSGGNAGTLRAGELANSYNTMTALGKAQREQLDSNNDRYLKARQLRGSFDEANQREYGQKERFNADAFNSANKTSAQLGYSAAQAKLAADNDWYGSMYANVDNIFKGIGAHKKENRIHNMIADMAANDIFGHLTPESYIARNFLTYAADGGKVQKKKKKRGLTI